MMRCLAAVVGLLASTLCTFAQVEGSFSPALPYSIGYNSTYGCQMYKGLQGTFIPVDSPDLRATAPSADVGGLSDYFVAAAFRKGSAANQWRTNDSWNAALTITATNGNLIVSSSGIDSATSSAMTKIVPTKATNWTATLYINSAKAGVLTSATNALAAVGLVAFETTNAQSYSLAYRFVDATDGARAPAFWANGSTANTVARTNLGVTSGVNVAYVSPGPVALQLSYNQPTKVLTMKGAPAPNGLPVSLKTIATVTLTADPVLVGISFQEYDALTSFTSSPTVALKAFQFQQ